MTKRSSKVFVLFICWLISSSSFSQKERLAVVSGLSVTGIMSALVLAKAGYEVHAYETRTHYTRRIHWTMRQAVVDELATIDPQLAQQYVEKVALKNTRSVVITKENEKKVRDIGAAAISSPSPLDVPKTGEELFQKPPNHLAEARVFEQFLLDYLKTIPNVHIHKGERMEMESRPNDSYAVKNLAVVPDLIVVSEGVSSSSAKFLKMKYYNTSPSRRQIAGVVLHPNHGEIRKNWRFEHAQPLLAQALNGGTSSTTWIVSDLSSAIDLPDGTEKQEIINKEFQRIAAQAMGFEGDPKTLRVEGPIEGTEPTVFQLQQRISRTAVFGTNVVLVGDSVGNAHWNAGGGVQVGMVSHIERLKTLVTDIGAANRADGLMRFNNGVVSDTLAWNTNGIVDFYPELNADLIREKMRPAVDAWLSNRGDSFDLMMSSLTTACKDLLEKSVAVPLEGSKIVD